MYKNRFKTLCVYCDKILKKYNSNIFTISNPNLHILKAHPELLNRYFFLNKLKKKKNLSVKMFRYFFSFFKEKSFFYDKNNSDRPKVLILSSLININHLNAKKDFYYGDIEKKLKKKGVLSKIVLRNFTNYSSNNLNHLLKQNKILLSSRVTFFKELYLILLTIVEYLKFNFFNKDKVSKYIFKNPLNIFNFTGIISSMRLCYQMEKIISIYSSNYLLITFEGHGWERVLIKYIKYKFPKIKIFAYQFSSITKSHHSIFRPLKKNYDPDVIFTSGSITKKKFLKNYKCPIYILGSNKFSANKLISKVKNKTVIVLPEGFLSETKILYNFTYLLAKKFQEYKFIFRLHPLIKDYNFFEYKKVKLKNLVLSNNNFNSDITLSSHVLYRGSAAAIEAVSRGLKPLYLNHYPEFNINPLYYAIKNKFNVSTINNFKKTIKKTDRLSYKKIQQLSKNYFTKINIDNFLKAIQ